MEVLRRELHHWSMVWASRRPMGLTQLPDDVLALDEAARLAWLKEHLER